MTDEDIEYGHTWQYEITSSNLPTIYPMRISFELGGDVDLDEILLQFTHYLRAVGFYLMAMCALWKWMIYTLFLLANVGIWIKATKRQKNQSTLQYQNCPKMNYVEGWKPWRVGQ